MKGVSFLPLILVIAGFIGFFVVCLNNIAFRLTVQENNLLVGVVDEKLQDSSTFKEIYNFLSSALSKAELKDKIEELSQSYGLDFGKQSFSYNQFGSNSTVHGQNYFSILRSSSSSQLETIVFSTSLTDKIEEYIGSVIVLFYLSQYMKKQVYLAKDVIILFVDQEEIGAQAWLEAYHSEKNSKSITYSDLSIRSGSIEAAFNIILPLYSSHVEIEMTGLNGQMPCLDLVATAFTLCQKHNLPVYLNNIPMSHYRDDPIQDIYTYFMSSYKQAVNSPEGIHSIFKPYQISSVSIIGVGGRRRISLMLFGNVLEGILRSFNNLQERLHASVFYFILPNFYNFASNGIYTPPVLVLIASLAVRVFFNIKVLKETNPESFSSDGLLKIVSISSIISIVYFYLMKRFPFTSMMKDLSVENLFPISLAIFTSFSIATLLISIFVDRKTDWIYTKIIKNFIWALFLCCYSCYNASTSFYMATLACPVVCLISVESRLKKVLSMISLLVICPPLALVYSQLFSAVVRSSIYTPENILNIAKTIDQDSLNNALKRAIIEYEDYGVINWTLYGVYCLIWMFTWSLLSLSPISTANSKGEPIKKVKTN